MNVRIDTRATIGLISNLRQLHRSAYPSAVRNTLNDAAFDMKKTTIQKSASDAFNVKNKTFFKKSTGVVKATGFNVNAMTAVAGFVVPSDRAGRKAIEGLSKQETGGVIDDGSRYLKYSRGGSLGKLVQKKNYYNKNNVITGRSQRRGTNKSKFVARAFRSKSENKPFFMNSMKGNFLVKTKTIKRLKNGKIDIKLNFLMMDRSVKKSRIHATHFAEKAGRLTQDKMTTMFIKNAEFQINKFNR